MQHHVSRRRALHLSHLPEGDDPGDQRQSRMRPPGRLDGARPAQAQQMLFVQGRADLQAGLTIPMDLNHFVQHQQEGRCLNNEYTEIDP
jgi:hypothetical protein